MRFSQRIGETPMQETIQKDTMSDSLRNKLLNFAFYVAEVQLLNSRGSYVLEVTIMNLANGFGLLKDDIPAYFPYFKDYVTKLALEPFWLYDFIEILVRETDNAEFARQEFNNILEEEKSAYRFDGNGLLIPITSGVELEEIERARASATPYQNVLECLNSASNSFSDRQNPNYKNTVAESVKAIESLCKIILDDNKATLGQAINKIDGLHTAFRESIEKLYGYASDTVRHGKIEQVAVAEHEARFVLVTCHSIVNYLISKYLIKS